MKSKECFGKYEDSNVSWHCLGCIIAKECKLLSIAKERKELQKNTCQSVNETKTDETERMKFCVCN